MEARTEAQEQQRAKSPLALRFEVVSCEFATTVLPPGRMIPIYTFHPPCPFGKTQPDQDCRMCRHVKLLPMGASDAWWAHRYIGVGAVFPIPDEACADEVVAALEAHDALPLQRPDVVPPHQEG